MNFFPIFLLVAFGLLAVAILVTVFAIRRARDGYEDEAGFHSVTAADPGETARNADVAPAERSRGLARKPSPHFDPLATPVRSH